ncbi:MAG: hypothetical protein HY678_10280 [Chloroflexi bacterium]|nr:hypothetical protein [Chloroflexota bacterium]
MPPINSADQATEKAVQFLKRHFAFQQPKSAKQVNGEWIVKVNVGLFFEQIATVTIDAKSGEVTAYDA